MRSTSSKTSDMTISFGTDGWRAVIADSFTFDNVRLVARAMARYLMWNGRKDLPVYAHRGGTYPAPFRAAASGLVVGYDTRFLSPQFARAVAEEVASLGVPALLAREFAPTPSVSLAVRDHKAAAAIMVTASHNPYQYNGLKFKPEYASSGLPEIMDAILPFVRAEQRQASLPLPNPASIQEISMCDGYERQLRSLVDVERIRHSDLDVVVDPMHGAGVGVIRGLLDNVTEVRGNPDPTFGGYNPEPIDKNLKPLSDMLKLRAQGREATQCVGVATDGDADRVGAMDATGHFFNSHEIFAIMLWHLVERKQWSGGVVRTFSTSHMIPMLAKHFGLPVYETPIGFKYIVNHMLSHDVLMGGEESGGLGIKNHIPERDGVLSSLLLLEAAAWENESFRRVLDRIHEITGPFAYDRTDLHLPSRDHMSSLVDNLKQQPPKTFAGQKVEAVATLDGVKFELQDHAWILFRPSGTEPVLRIYVEARSKQDVDAILKEGVRVAGGSQAGQASAISVQPSSS